MNLTPQPLAPGEHVAPPDHGQSAAPARATAEQSGWFRAVSIAATFALLVIFAAWVRGATIWPEATGLNAASYDDEGVYATAAQLLAQGKHPYRDYFYAHPPLGPALLTPAVDYRFTTWGSPTSFMLLRYASVAYGALTIGLVFLIAWRIWGLLGGVFGALLLAVDPLAVWTGRHVMLEGPLFFLTALAVLAYVLAREEEEPPPALLLLAGFFAAAAGGVKLQGLIILVAMVVDLLIRRRGVLLAMLLAGAMFLWLPLWGYLAWLSGYDPLGQFLFLQLLRPGDGIAARPDRVAALWSDSRLVLAAGGLALLALPGLLLRPNPVKRAARASRRRATTPGGIDLPRLSLVDGTVSEAPSRPKVRSAMAAIGATSRVEPEHPSRGWSLLLPWLALVVATLALNRSFYDHYGAHLTLPLAILAGAVPLVVARGLRADWGGRVVGLGVAVAACALAIWLAPGTWQTIRQQHEDRLYAIVSRYATDAVGPDAGILALDAQFSFRAARRPAREDHDRFLIDSYGTLLYHGLGIERASLAERLRRVVTEAPGHDPYPVMWRPQAQAQIRASVERSDLVIIDKTSDGRLTDDTRRWLASRGRLVERQERYAIYRIQR